MRRINIVGLVLLLGYIQPLSAQDFSEPIIEGERGQALHAYMQKIAEEGFSGAVLVAQGNSVLLAHGYGYTNREADISNSMQTVFDIGSLTKQFTGAAITLLIERNKLAASDLITKFFENVPADKQGITVHHLLTHTAGFPGGLGYDYAKITRDEYIKTALAAELVAPPGERNNYSNVGYALLAAIIEQVTGESYDAFTQRELFKPAGMQHTGYIVDGRDDNQVAHGYRGEQHWGAPHEQNWAEDGPWWHLRGNGGTLATLPDMWRWHLALSAGKILSPASLELYQHPHVPEEAPGMFYAYGWVITEFDGKKVIRHNGGNPYFSNDFLRFPDQNLVVLISANDGDHRGPKHSDNLASIALGADGITPPARPARVSIEEIKSSASGKRALAFLELLRSWNEKDAKTFVEQAFAAKLVEKYGVEKLVGMLTADVEEFGQGELKYAERAGDERINLVVAPPAGGEWRVLGILFEQPAAKIRGILAGNVMPDDEAPASEALPDTPAGKTMALMLDLFNSNPDAGALKQFVKDQFSASFAQAFALEIHAEQLSKITESVRGAKIVGMRAVSPQELGIMLRQEKAQPVRLYVTVSGTSPHRIEGIEIRD